MGLATPEGNNWRKTKIKGGHAAVKIYLSQDWFLKFLNGDENASEYEGFYNEGESWIFLPLPGYRNASLRMVREGTKTDLPDDPSCVTAVVSPDGAITCFTVDGGAIVEREVEMINPREDVYARNRGLLETRCLKDKTVLIAGCGSVGSTMAVELARAGIGSLILADPDHLEPSNICRHQAGLQHLGRLKVNAVKDMVFSINPFIAVETHPEDICSDMETMETTGLLSEKCDLIICTTDTDSSRIFINDLSLALKKPCIHAGLHERAASGIVQSVIPGQGACFLCHREKILRETRKGNGAVAYSEKGEEIAVQPGLSSQINVVAEVAVLKAIEIMTAPTHDEENSRSDFGKSLTFIKTRSRPASGEEGRLTFSSAHFSLEAFEKCPACGDDPSLLGQAAGFGQDP